jgi:hypothetical protein
MSRTTTHKAYAAIADLATFTTCEALCGRAPHGQHSGHGTRAVSLLSTSSLSADSLRRVLLRNADRLGDRWGMGHPGRPLQPHDVAPPVGSS